MMTYQLVSESGSFAAPSGKDLRHGTRETADHLLSDWASAHDRVGSDRIDASLLVWKGYYEDVTDIYPDYQVKYGTRGGFVWEAV